MFAKRLISGIVLVILAIAVVGTAAFCCLPLPWLFPLWACLSCTG